jgi:hypothetical protein
MTLFSIEAVGWRINVDPDLPSRKDVELIQKRLWGDFAHQKSDWSPWEPRGEFLSRHRNQHDRKFRLPYFNRGILKKGEFQDDGCLGRGGFDALGTYQLRYSTVTIYVDSCRKAVKRYGVDYQALIQIVLIHELAHLMTHRGFLEHEGASDQNWEKPPDNLTMHHLWEYTAQCATYAYLRKYSVKEALMAFATLSEQQPFEYKTWKGLEAVETVNSRLKASVGETVAVVKTIFYAILPKTPSREDYFNGDSDYEE